ncbi:hypothetical protein F2Q69_00016608 [Brassica cretica]|uniref:Uncharacterized protein n=1 Tax=Brassica cretica TaxID=69181 RepID=A0A8S9QV54_BRACR|nr:hypothetical protein F2Q69_00016608 [Brassica cretica]
MIAPSAGYKNDSSSVNVLLNIAGVDANLQSKHKGCVSMSRVSASGFTPYFFITAASENSLNGIRADET